MYIVGDGGDDGGAGRGPRRRDGDPARLAGGTAVGGKLHFLQVRDGTGTIQGVVGKNDVPADVFARVDHLAHETALEVVVARATGRGWFDEVTTRDYPGAA